MPQENILHYRILRPRAWTLRGPHTPEALELLKGVLARDDLTPALRSHALRMRAVNLSYAGDDSAGIKDLQDAIRLDPASPFNHIYLGISFREQGRFDEAADAMRQAAAIDPDVPGFQIELASALRLAGRGAESLVLLARLCESDTLLEPCAQYARGLLDAGRRGEALLVARKAEGLEGAGTGYYDLACFWAVAGDRARALRMLREALNRGMDPQEADPAAEKDFTSLRADPDFKAITRELARRRAPAPR